MGGVGNLSTATFTQIPDYKTSKKNDISKKYSKQALRQGKLREITKCLLTWFSKIQADIFNNISEGTAFFLLKTLKKEGCDFRNIGKYILPTVKSALLLLFNISLCTVEVNVYK